MLRHLQDSSVVQGPSTTTWGFPMPVIAVTGPGCGLCVSAEARQPCYRQLTFDSDVFKFPVASISPDVALHDLQAVIKDCTAHGMHLAYWAPKGGPIMALPDWFSGFAAGCNVLLRRELSSAFELRALPASSFRLSSMPAGPASCSVVELAFVAGQHSRFRTDPSLTRAQFERLYTAWADNSTQRKVAAEVIAAYDESATADGKPLGFITVQLQPRTSTASIGLLAVLPACQRQGLGALLMHAALSWASAAGAKQMEVVTQADNAPAIGLYTSHGFEQVGSPWLTILRPMPRATAVTAFSGKA